MLKSTYYAQNYAGIIYQGLPTCHDYYREILQVYLAKKILVKMEAIKKEAGGCFRDYLYTDFATKETWLLTYLSIVCIQKTRFNWIT